MSNVHPLFRWVNKIVLQNLKTPLLLSWCNTQATVSSSTTFKLSVGWMWSKVGCHRSFCFIVPPQTHIPSYATAAKAYLPKWLTLVHILVVTVHQNQMNLSSLTRANCENQHYGFMGCLRWKVQAFMVTRSCFQWFWSMNHSPFLPSVNSILKKCIFHNPENKMTLSNRK